MPDNAYHYLYETSDGQIKEETGSVAENGILKVVGSYSYISDDGKTYSVRYTSDENGFRASGEHLPKTNTALEDSLSPLPVQPQPTSEPISAAPVESFEATTREIPQPVPIPQEPSEDLPQ